MEAGDPQHPSRSQAFARERAAGSISTQPDLPSVPRLVVVLPLQPLAAGSGFSLRAWPLHLTVAPTFEIASLATAVAAIGPLLAGRSAISVRAGHSEGFGRAVNRPAAVVEASADLQVLHQSLCTALLDAGATFDHPDFIGAGYRPHVTRTRTASVRDGDVLQLRQTAIVDMAPHGDGRLRRVVWTATLG
jgi:2'-5' RNA ligase